MQKHKLPVPSDAFLEYLTNPDSVKKTYVEVGVINSKLGQKKGSLSPTKNNRKKNEDRIAEYQKEIDSLKRYRERVVSFKKGKEMIKEGKGIYAQKKRNAFKINPQTGIYRNVIVDVPKLYGQLKLNTYKDGKKVSDKQVDFDTIDLLTKRFNSKKKHSPLSKMVFDELNKLSDIPIHRIKNYRKIGSGVVYNNAADLLDRLELLGGSILAGSNGAKNEFSQIVHTLNKLGVLNNNQLKDLLKEYVI